VKCGKGDSQPKRGSSLLGILVVPEIEWRKIMSLRDTIAHE
jgi:hypothetical protein